MKTCSELLDIDCPHAPVGTHKAQKALSTDRSMEEKLHVCFTQYRMEYYKAVKRVCTQPRGTIFLSINIDKNPKKKGGGGKKGK